MGVFRPIWYRKSNGRWEPAFWIGPYKNIVPTQRSCISSINRNLVMIRQSNKCNACNDKICIYPFPNADLDHIIPLSLGGKNTISNLQFLCVLCHRHKTAMENERHIKRFPVNENDVNGIVLIYPSDKKDLDYNIPDSIEEFDPIGAMDQILDEEREFNYIVRLNYSIPKIKLYGNRDINTLFQEFAYSECNKI